MLRQVRNSTGSLQPGTKEIPNHRTANEMDPLDPDVHSMSVVRLCSGNVKGSFSDPRQSRGREVPMKKGAQHCFLSLKSNDLI